jgi:hypothetical protein
VTIAHVTRWLFAHSSFLISSFEEVKLLEPIGQPLRQIPLTIDLWSEKCS